MRAIFIFAGCFFLGLMLTAQSYKIHFTASGDIHIPDSVRVHNADRDTALMLSGSDTLLLQGSQVGADNNVSSGYGYPAVYPNPFSGGECMLELYQDHTGEVLITLFDLQGRVLLVEEVYLQSGRSQIIMSGLPAGILLLEVQSDVFSGSHKIISMNDQGGAPRLSNVGNTGQIMGQEQVFFTSNAVKGLITMPYEDGETLLFTGYANEYQVSVTLYPSSSQGIDFEFDFTYYPGTVHCVPSEPAVVTGVTNPVTGDTWMDRNLGSRKLPDSLNDVYAYGDLYQWGRFADGHQCRISSIYPYRSFTPVHNSGQNWDGRFIKTPSSPYDWLFTPDSTLWQGLDGLNNPCPRGYRLPVKNEYNNEMQSWSSPDAAGAFNSPLLFSKSGRRHYNTGALFNIGVEGHYWTSTMDDSSNRITALIFDDNSAYFSLRARAYGKTIRCIKD